MRFLIAFARINYYNGNMSTKNLNTTLHTKLETISETPSGFSASEVTGYSPEQVRRAAEALVAAGRMHRAKVSPRRVRYFANEKQVKTFLAIRPAAAQPRVSAGMRTKASWSASEPGLITSRTKITKAAPPPRGVFRTNTYLQF